MKTFAVGLSVLLGVATLVPPSAAGSAPLSRAKFRQKKVYFCRALRKNAPVILQRHCTVEKQRAPGGRAQAISYLEDASNYETNIFAYS